MPRNLDGLNALRLIDKVAQKKLSWDSTDEEIRREMGMSGDPAEVNETFMDEKGKPSDGSEETVF